MGFIREAFKEGYKPGQYSNNCTDKHPQKSQTQGNTNPVFSTSEKTFPIRIPRKLPKTAPSKLIMMDSYKNCCGCFLSSRQWLLPNRFLLFFPSPTPA